MKTQWTYRYVKIFRFVLTAEEVKAKRQARAEVHQQQNDSTSEEPSAKRQKMEKKRRRGKTLLDQSPHIQSSLANSRTSGWLGKGDFKAA